MDERARERISLELDKPSSARVYDYLLGGHHNYAIDREFGDQQAALLPDLPRAFKSNRAFIGRAVRYALDRGVRQFVDIGSGLPSEGQPHHIADDKAPGEAHVVYVDNEPIAHAHSEILLTAEADPTRHRALFGDFFDTRELWQQITDTGLINPDEPICLLMTGILHFMSPQRQPEIAMAFYRDRLPSGSLLVLTHAWNDVGSKGADDVAVNYSKTTNPFYWRDRNGFAVFFGDWTLVDPGVTWVVQWRPDGREQRWWGNTPGRSYYLAGVAEKS